MPGNAILIVEDEDDIRFHLRTALEGAGYQCFLASEGIGAIKQLVDHPEIGTIISDLRMPLFGGDYWLNFLKQFCASKYRILLQTACPVEDLPPGMSILLKPYRSDELLRVLRETLQARAA